MQKKTAFSLVALAAVVSMMAGTSRHLKTGIAAQTIKPVTVEEHALTSVKIMSHLKDAGGSGVILTSTALGSTILTNKHVCELVQAGGYVERGHEEYQVQAYKIYPAHDLCMVSISDSLGINTLIAPAAPEIYSESRVSGHPSLLPMIVSPGHFSGEEKVKLIVDSKPCNGHEKDREAMYCKMLGGIPVFRIYDAQVLSSLIMPGSSGSGVFNKAGELSGIAFAGSAGLSYAYIVPWSFVRDFVTVADTIPWRYPNPDAEPKKFMKMLFKTMALCETQEQLPGLCRVGDRPSIWRKHR
jgi:hypothetical protein